MKKSNTILIFSIFYSLIASIRGECNVCNAQTGLACISDTELQACRNNTPYGNVYQCNTGQYCSVLGRCTDNFDMKACRDCNKCDSNGIFACTGVKTFALCLGTNNVSDLKAQCAGDLVCNINYPNICVMGPPTCSYKDDATEAGPEFETC